MSRRRSLAPALWALAAGLVTFLALESAVARRVGLDLLLPAAAGAFLPGRLARLCACLVVCFALALTDRGRSFGRALDRFCERDRGRWAVSAAVAALFFLWTLRVTVLEYMTMDDVTFQQSIVRIPQEGLGATAGVFSNQLLSWVLGKLYGLCPNVYWYLGYHLTVLLASVTIIGRCVLCRVCRRGWPVWAGCAAHGLLCLGLFLYCFAAIAFTVTPAVAGSAAVALVLCRDEARTTPGRIASDIAAAVLLCLCILQRKETGQALLCFWALAVAYQLIRMLLRRAGMKQIALFTGACLASLALVLGLSRAELVPVDPEYRRSEYYRSRIGDFLKDDLTMEQYAQVGVPQELAVLIHGWFFLDQRVTTDLFSQLTAIYDTGLQAAPAAPPEGGGADTASPESGAADADAGASDASAEGAASSDEPAPAPAAAGALGKLSSLAAELAKQVTANGQMRWRIGCVLALLAACLTALLRFGRRYWPELLCALCAVGGMVILLLYLVDMGRFPLRTFLVVVIPATVTLLLTALTAPGDNPVPGGMGKLAAVLAVLSGAALTICCAVCAYTAPHAAEPVSHGDVFALEKAVEQYAFANSDKTLISCVYDRLDLNIDPLHDQYVYPENIVQWGYCGDLAKSPEERLYADALFRDDVLFMTDNMGITLYLLQYLTLDWGPVQAVVQDRVGPSIYMCRLEQLAPSPDYTGWYEQNGMTYYFQDGQALTGEQVIDGESYTFAPVGAQSQLAVASGSALVYSTDAYSLVEPETETP